MASRKGSLAEAMAAAAADQPRDVADSFDPVHEWLDGGANFLLRLNLPGFKKEDFRVHVEPTGRLTIRGQGLADGGAGSVPVGLHKVFQLPPTSDLDGIAGRFDGGVLTLTVPKLLPGAVAPPQAPEEEEDDVADKPTDQKAKVDREAERRIEAARATLAARRHRGEEEKQTGRSKKPPAKKVDEVGEEPKAVATATPSDMAAKREDEDDKAKAEHKTKVDREAERRIEAARATLAARRHRGEEEKQTGRSKKPPAKKVDEVGEELKAVVTATPRDMAAKREDEDDKAKAEHKAKVGGEAERWFEAARERLAEAEWEREREKGRRKERATEEGFKWADAIGKKKGVIATAVVAFTLGAFVSYKLFSRN